MNERELVSALAQYMQRQYPRVIYRFDLAAGLKLTVGQARRHKLINPHRGYPDMFIAVPRLMPHGTQRGRLFLAINREGTRIKTRDGRWANTHVEEQAAVLDLSASPVTSRTSRLASTKPRYLLTATWFRDGRHPSRDLSTTRCRSSAPLRMPRATQRSHVHGR